ncbi:MAG: hypothetical protein PHS80_04125 [Methanothrix sp.]|nr:hypothetical protein [Methanothrix sp.]MDD4446360.1 hypothetical protein [Methanothrix sp.]
MVSVSSLLDNGEGALSANAKYDLDVDTDLAYKSVLGDGRISSSLSAEGNGRNKIDQSAGNQETSISSSIDSIGILSSTASGYASSDIIQVGQNLQSIGQSDSSVSGASGSVSTAQNAGVLEGYITTSQMITAGSGTISSLQATNLAGALGYADGVAQSSDNTVHLTGGLNGVGGMSGVLGATASDGVSAVGSFEADSLESKTYSAVKSTSADGDAYSYLSSAGHMESSMSGSANGHVTSNQELDANGDVKVYASSTSDDSSSKIYDVEGESVSGSMSASAGSPATIDTDLVGDIQNSESSFVPTPGSWVWNGFGGILTSNPFQLEADDGKTHIFAKGTDNGLWDNVDGDWQGLGGTIDSTYSDPFALQDEQGDIHILVKSSDGALWDRVYNGGWWNLGGTLTSNPSAAFELGSDGYMYIVVRGTDNALWSRELNTADMSGDWYFCDGVLASNPQIIFDSEGNWHTFVRGSDNALWDLNMIKKDDHFYEGEWSSLGGIITSDTIPVVDPFNPNLIYTSVRGGDESLWYNTLDTTLGTSTWTYLGGHMVGNPAPVVDTDGVLHNFVRGNDRQLWDNADGTWYDLDGYLTSSPNAIRDKEGKLHVAVVGGDNGLWVNTVGIGTTPTTLVGSFACDYSKIQSAVDEISAGGIVKVLSGTYNENVQIDKSLTVKGAGKADTIVNGQLAGSVFTIGLNNPSAQVSLLDMTIENGNAQNGGGIYNKGTLDLTGILLTDNSAGNGGGIYNNGGTLHLKDVSITENAAANGGGLFSTNSHVTFDGAKVFVTANRAISPSPFESSWYQGWGVYINSGTPTTTFGFNPTTQVKGNVLVPVA